MTSPFAIQTQRPLRHFKRWLMIGWAILGMIIVVSLIPDPGGALLGDFKPNDKVAHFIAYGILMGWFSQLYHAMHTRLLLAVLFICLGVTLEFLQGFTYYRMYEHYDMLANSIGVILGYVFSFGVLGELLLKFEQRFAHTTTN